MPGGGSIMPGGGIIPGGGIMPGGGSIPCGGGTDIPAGGALTPGCGALTPGGGVIGSVRGGARGEGDGGCASWLSAGIWEAAAELVAGESIWPEAAACGACGGGVATGLCTPVAKGSVDYT